MALLSRANLKGKAYEKKPKEVFAGFSGETCIRIQFDPRKANSVLAVNRAELPGHINNLLSFLLHACKP